MIDVAALLFVCGVSDSITTTAQITAHSEFLIASRIGSVTVLGCLFVVFKRTAASVVAQAPSHAVLTRPGTT